MKKTKPAAKPPKPAAIIEYGVNHLELERRIDAVHTAAENLLSITQIDGEAIEVLRKSLLRAHVATSLLCVGLIADMVLWWVLR